jgi:hypothetical protein
MKVLIILLSFFPTSLFAQIIFDQYTIMEKLADEITDIQMVDLNNDSLVDCLVASTDDHKISWFENMGNGIFGQQHIVSNNAEEVISIFTADVDGDNIIDILSACQTDNIIAWYKNDGTGNFGSQQIISNLVENPRSVYATDLDGDGDNDVLSASLLDNKIAWYENLGNGIFGIQNIISQQHLWAEQVLAIDIDNDSDLDVVACSILDNKLAWYENLGAGSFGSQNIISTQVYQPVKFVCDDIDNDNDNDIVISTIGDDKISWYENLGSGTFGTENVVTTQYISPRSIDLCDLNNDGYKDIVFGNVGLMPIIAWCMNLAGASFSQAIPMDSTLFSFMLSCADIDNDGDMDVATGFKGSLVYYENINNANTLSKHVISYGMNGPLSLHASDLDGDNLKDVVVGSANSIGLVHWFRNTGETFTLMDTLNTEVFRVDDIDIADIDVDGQNDVLFVSESDTLVGWFKNSGVGQSWSMEILSDTAQRASCIASADFDGDNDTEVVFGTTLNTQNTKYRRLSYFDKLGNGSFGSEINIFQASYTNVKGFEDIATVDLDGDGDMDLITAEGTINWYENDGSANFTRHQVAGSDDWPKVVCPADVNGDNKLDIVWIDSHPSYPSRLCYCLNDGFNEFTSINNYNTVVTGLPYIAALTVNDLDLDGDSDIIINAGSVSGLLWFENDGTGIFFPGASIDDSISISNAFSADMDNDGDIDIIYSSSSTDKVLYAENIGYQAFDSAQACQEDTLLFAGQEITTPGTYYDSLQSIYGLDSVLVLEYSHIPPPLVELLPFPSDTICIEEDFALLPNAVPPDGVYYGNGIVGNELNLYAAGLGIHELIYTYTDTTTGCSNADSTLIEIVQCLSVERSENGLSLKIYPNPASSMLYIEWLDCNKESIQIELYDNSARLVKKQVLGNKLSNVDFSGLKSGMYLLVLRSKNRTEIRRVIIR